MLRWLGSFRRSSHLVWCRHARILVSPKTTLRFGNVNPKLTFLAIALPSFIVLVKTLPRSCGEDDNKSKEKARCNVQAVAQTIVWAQSFVTSAAFPCRSLVPPVGQKIALAPNFVTNVALRSCKAKSREEKKTKQ